MSETREATPAARRGPRWLLLGSLALNLFFIGIAVAMAVREPPPRRWDRNVFVRIERLAETLPSSDAQVLRSAVNAKHDAIEKAQDSYYKLRDGLRDSLRQEPFKVENMRAAVTKTSAARQVYYELLQGTFTDAAAKMSSGGRHALADWPRGPKPGK
jgi:uncharacterized membrane protein